MVVRADTLFLIAAWALAAIGALLLLWALFGDWWKGVRIRRRTGEPRRRCPNCWYDMRGVEGLRCPECGREAKRERGLRKSKRKPRLVAFACVVAIVAWALSITPSVRANGWPAAVPTAALVIALPWLDPPGANVNWTAGAAMPALPWRERLWDDLVSRRLQSARPLASWERRRIISLGARDASRHDIVEIVRYNQPLQVLATCQPLTDDEWREWGPKLVPRWIRTREHWPEGAEIFAMSAAPGWVSGAHLVLYAPPRLGEPLPLDPIRRPQGAPAIQVLGGWHDGATPIVQTALKAPALAVDLFGEAWWQPPGARCTGPGRSEPRTEARVLARCTLPVRVEGSLDDCMRRVEIPEADAALRAGTFTADVQNSAISVRIDHATAAAVAQALGRADTTFAVRVEILHDGKIIDSRRGVVVGRRAGTAIERDPERKLADLPGGGAARQRRGLGLGLRITPDQVLALRDFESNRCWDGGPIEVPLTVERPPPKPAASQ